MRKWNARDDLELLDRAYAAIREKRLLEPGTINADDPVDLRGLAFPTVTLCKELELPTVVVSRVAGRQEFRDATIHRVDFSKAHLDFSVWNDCRFDQVTFDGARLHSVRFFGCRFDACSFHSAELRDASFSVGSNGRETEIVGAVFERADFRGASCHNPVLRSTSFINCKLDGFVFESALFVGVEIVGRYKELTIRGTPGEPARNRLKLDLSKAKIMWLDANRGVDLSSVILPADGSCIVITDRVRAVDVLVRRLRNEAGAHGSEIARFLAGIYSERSISPKDPSQTTFLISRGMIADFAETDDEGVVTSLFMRIRSIAEEEGFLAANRLGGTGER
jgi:uncharacterized protein YjbI with pentapeptide repeats